MKCIYSKETGEIVAYMDADSAISNPIEGTGCIDTAGVFPPANFKVVNGKIEEKPLQVEMTTSIKFRDLRNMLLAKSDWTQVVDSPLPVEKIQEWKTYRTELRDFFVDWYEDKPWPTEPA